MLPEGKKVEWKQWGGAVVVVGVLLVLGYFMLNNTAKAPAVSNTQDVKDVPEGAMASHKYEWSFALLGGNAESGANQVEVTLTHNGEPKVVGTYEGDCSILGDPGFPLPLAEGELTGVVCYWAGSGDEVGVFLEDGVYSVKHGTIDESSAEEAGFRGNYETLFTL